MACPFLLVEVDYIARLMKRSTYFGATAVVLLTAAHSSAAPLALTDPFTDGSQVGGSDNSGIAWYDRSTNSALSVGNDTVIGTGNALVWTPKDSTVNSRGFTGVLSGLTLNLDNIGDSAKFTFDFHFFTVPQASSFGLTFGFYNSNGSIVAADDSVNQDNDFGYRTDFGTGATSGIAIGKEANVGGGGTGTGTTDTAALTLQPGSVPVNINDAAKHSASFNLERTSGGIEVTVGFDGQTVGTATSVSQLYTSFDEIVFSQGSATKYAIDNVVLTSNVPEPGTAAGLLLGASLLGLRRRRAAR